MAVGEERVGEVETEVSLGEDVVDTIGRESVWQLGSLVDGQLGLGEL